MKTMLCAIAKNEEDYIEEWIDYHLKLGFSKILLFLNNWEYRNENPNVILVQKNTNDNWVQSKSYNEAILEYQNEYDWIAFFDIDEFLVLKKHRNIQEYLKTMDKFEAVGINWRIFGDSGLKKQDGTGVLKRFTKCQNGLNKHIKTIIHCSKLKNNFIHECCHCTKTAIVRNSTINSAGLSFSRGAENFNDIDRCLETAYLNHYRNKTIEECRRKCDRNQKGFTSMMPYLVNFDKDFTEYNRNEETDTTAKDFLYES